MDTRPKNREERDLWTREYNRFAEKNHNVAIAIDDADKALKAFRERKIFGPDPWNHDGERKVAQIRVSIPAKDALDKLRDIGMDQDIAVVAGSNNGYYFVCNLIGLSMKGDKAVALLDRIGPEAFSIIKNEMEHIDDALRDLEDEKKDEDGPDSD